MIQNGCIFPLLTYAFCLNELMDDFFFFNVETSQNTQPDFLAVENIFNLFCFSLELLGILKLLAAMEDITAESAQQFKMFLNHTPSLHNNKLLKMNNLKISMGNDF